MKYFFLIVACYAVKCEDVGNNYFVIKMPEDIRQQDIKYFKKPFRVYWNVPTMQCASKKIPFQNLFEKFGIIQNDDDRFIGNKIVLIYDEKDFPAVIFNKTTGKNILRNGGVPQEGNLKDHLIAFENNLNIKIPDPYFDGIAIIDFESWRPVFLQNFGALVTYKNLSIEIEKQLHNWWPKMWIEKEASLRFETAARQFMQTTLTKAKEMRPNALWGYYGFPYCFNMRSRDLVEKCAKTIPNENDNIYWLWAESTALFPSLYSSVSLTSSQLSSLIKGRVKEASRVRGIETPIFPYFWYRYRDAGFMTEKDLDAAFSTLYQSDASGLIIWGSSNDVNTVDKCNKLFKYVETVLGPKIAKYTKHIKNIHRDPLENNEIYLKETLTAYDGFSYSRSTKSLNNKDKMFSTETSTVNNKYTTAESEISETLNNDVMSSSNKIKSKSFIFNNNYFVIKMPEDIKYFKKPFRVYWNVPTMQCASKKIPFQNLFEKFGIIQNDDDRFIGNKIVLIYDEKDFPAVIFNKTTGKNILRNGGVPQEGNLEEHLIAFENDLNVKIPDPYFDGIAIIDFESWRPVFLQNFGALVPHKNLSIDIEKQLHNWWPKMWIEKEASLRFETAARQFMQTTLTKAKEMRPNALWGYYGFPYCFNMRSRDLVEKCAKTIPNENDNIYWLWAESTALFPSLYSSVSLTSSQLSSLIKGRVKEASRVRGIETPIFPYFWYRYRDAGFMTEKDLDAAFSTLYQSDASGLIIWGSSNDVNTVDKCNKLFKYVETVLGPKIAKYTKHIKNIHRDPLENNEIYLKETLTAYDGFSYSRSTKSLNNKDKMFSTETSTVNNKYTTAESEISETLNNDVMSSSNKIKSKSFIFNNNYFVIKMPEDIKYFKKPFRVYWNVPTMQCASKKIPFQNLFEKFGIIQNDDDRFIGNKIVLIYDEKDFPAVIFNKTTGKNILRNGGVPQEGNLEEHLIAFENDLNVKIPDPYFDGIAIIDFESWRPVFLQNFGALVPHKNLSIDIEKQLHNWWPKMWIEKEASLRFETAARQFMQTTLTKAKEMRPNALWGYYGFPYCFNMRSRDLVEKCAKTIPNENDNIYWLWAESTALFPSLYSSVLLTSSQLSSLIKGRVKEASRVRGIETPIFPYFWYRYRDAGFMTEKDLDAAFSTLYQSDASGLIIWGSSNDVNTVDKCNKLFKYVETVLGPKIAKYTKHIKNIHRDPLENKEIYLKETSTAYDGFSYSRSTKSLINKDKMFSTETSTANNKYTTAESEISETLNNDMMSSTESTIEYNVYTNSNDLQILNNFDLSLSLLGSSFYSKYMNISQSIPTLNNDDTFRKQSAITYDKNTYIDENSHSLNNDDLPFSSETSTAYREYTNSDQSSKTQNNDEILSSEETTKACNEYSNTEEYVPTLNNDDRISSSESSTFGYEYSDRSTKTLKNDKVSLENILITKFVDTIRNDNVISSSQSSIFDYENSDHSTPTLNNEETSPENISPEKIVNIINNENVLSSSKFSNFDYENNDRSTPTLNNEETSLENISPENYVNTINNVNVTSSSKFSNFDYENNDHSIPTLNNEETSPENISPEKIVNIINNENVLSSSKFSNFDYENNDRSTPTLNNEETSLENISPENYVNTINNVNVTSSSKFSNFDYENNDHSIPTLNNEETSSEKISPENFVDIINNDNVEIDNSNRNESSQTLNYEETTIIYNKSSDTKENVQTLNNDDRPSSSESSFIHDGNSDNSTKTLNNDDRPSSSESSFIHDGNSDNSTKTLNNDEMSSNNKTISSKGTFPALDEISYTDKSTDVLNYGEIITDHNEFKSTGNDFRNNNTLLYSSEDRFDYLIEVDNSTNIESFKQSEYNNSANIDVDDYLIFGRNLKNVQNLKENITDSKLETVYDTTQADNNQETGTTSKHFKERSNDLVVRYIDKKHEIKENEDSTSSKVELLQNITLLNSDDDRSDYLIKVENSTNMETYNQSFNSNITNVDDDYLVIVTDFNNKKYEKNNILENNLNLDLYSKTQTEYNLVSDTTVEDYSVTDKDLDPIVAYINKTIDNMKFQNSNKDISTEDESLNNLKVLNSDGDTFDYLIKPNNFSNTETDKQYEHRENTNSDNDYIIIIKNLDD